MLKNRIINFILSLISVVSFFSIFTKPAAPSHHYPKAWAHGVGFVLPRMLSTLFFAILALGILVHFIKTLGAKKAILHPLTFVSCLLLLPAVYVLFFVLWTFIAVHVT